MGILINYTKLGILINVTKIKQTVAHSQSTFICPRLCNRYTACMYGQHCISFPIQVIHRACDTTFMASAQSLWHMPPVITVLYASLCAMWWNSPTDPSPLMGGLRAPDLITTTKFPVFACQKFSHFHLAFEVKRCWVSGVLG